MRRIAKHIGLLLVGSLMTACAADQGYQSTRYSPDVSSEFPEVKDWNSLVFTTKFDPGGLCIGHCSFYSIAIHGDGTVEYSGDFNAVVPGDHRARIPQAAVRVLFERARKFQYVTFLGRELYNLEYPEDANISEGSIAYDGRLVASGIGDLAGAVASAADAERWVEGNDHTVASLRAEGWDFQHADETNLRMLEMAARTRNLDLVRAFLDVGFPILGDVGCQTLVGAIEGRNWATFVGSERKNENVLRDSIVQMLVAAGAPAQWKASTCDAVVAAAQRGALRPMEALLKTRPDINVQDQYGNTALVAAAEGWNLDGVAVDRSDYPAIIRLLMAAGPHDKSEISAAMAKAARNRNTPLVRFFLSAGAQPHVAP